ncbi:inner membrane protein YhjD [Nakamurella endophytica]|uniref:Inner membrane protein YhjD n=1 Tax=Nakamurella endophytica TaxID=1748367 RepID=A0A917WG46_9ACTN|nr:inner membrane protein YhjD [Nakamurella endophytica]GGM02456.1 inner membrane protein YhjD [Nakamurella endophytica]
MTAIDPSPRAAAERLRADDYPVEERAEKKPSALAARIKALTARPGILHLTRAGGRFTERLGTQFAGAITYFSFLALVPILMVAFAVVGFVLAGQPGQIDELKGQITKQIPGTLGSQLSDQLNSAIDARYTVGIIGLVVALYSGISWMGNVRNAIQAQWRPDFDEDQETAQESLPVNLLRSFLRLVGLGVALLLSIVLSSVGGALTSQVLDWLNLSDVGWLKPVLVIVPILLAMAADVLVFLWVYTALPPRHMRAPRKALIRGSIAAAVGFELLKQALALFPSLLTSTSAKIFGPIIGLLFFFNLTAMLVLFVAAWIATAPGSPGLAEKSTQDPGPDDVPPAVLVVQEPMSRPKLAGLLGAGALLGWGVGRRRR